jgi:hypothetical protein
MDIKPLTAEEVAIINRMADLMEQGSQGMRQITGQYFDLHGDGVCAIGACLRAAGVKSAPSDNILVNHALGVATWPRVEYPTNVQRWTNWMGEYVPVMDAIIMLNDVAGWNFSRIIDWLRRVASQEVAS